MREVKFNLKIVHYFVSIKRGKSDKILLLSPYSVLHINTVNSSNYSKYYPVQCPDISSFSHIVNLYLIRRQGAF